MCIPITLPLLFIYKTGSMHITISTLNIIMNTLYWRYAYSNNYFTICMYTSTSPMHIPINCFTIIICILFWRDTRFSNISFKIKLYTLQAQCIYFNNYICSSNFEYKCHVYVNTAGSINNFMSRMELYDITSHDFCEPIFYVSFFFL